MDILADLEIPLLIDGVPCRGEQRFEVRDPGRLSERVGWVAVADGQDVDRAARAAHRAFTHWRNVPAHERAACLEAAAAAMAEIAEDLALTLAREQGMLLNETRRDVANGVKALREAAAIGPAFLAPEVVEDGECWISTEKVPRGVVAAIVPWNAPMGLTMGKVGPALITGNTLVVKPSPFAPIAVSQALARVAAHLPPGVLNVVHGDPAGPALVAHPLVRKVSFTGSIPTGRAVMRDAAAAVKHVTMELGGNDPAIVLDDARPEEVVPAVVKQAMARSGQVCYAVKRVYVPRASYRLYCDAFCAAVDELRIGYGLDPKATLAPLNNRNQYAFVQALAERTERAGARVHRLGKKLESAVWEDGYYLRPMVATDVDPQAEVVTVEQFGPLLPLIAYDTEEQALELANSTDYGLASSVWSADPQRALELARRLEAGVTFINSHTRTSLGDRRMPFGGVKQSGLGRTRTELGLAEYIEYHAISLNKGRS
jgi:acyl-CoA reductase-like NAD-dependent aldehyde dehydrogenase